MNIDEIIEITEIGYDDSVDIEVDGDNLFYANDILTHNSQFNRDAMEMSIEDLHEGKIADSWKKMMIADGLIAMASNPEERRHGILNLKGLKNRNGPKDWILNMRIQYELLKISEPTNSTNKARDKMKEIAKKRKENKNANTDK